MKTDLKVAPLVPKWIIRSHPNVAFPQPALPPMDPDINVRLYKTEPAFKEFHIKLTIHPNLSGLIMEHHYLNIKVYPQGAEV